MSDNVSPPTSSSARLSLLSRSRVVVRLVLFVLVSAVLVGIAAAVPYVKEWWKPSLDERGSGLLDSVSSVPGQPGSFELKPNVVEKLRIETATVQAAVHTRPLRLGGSFGIDTNYLARVHSRFPGEVVVIGDAKDENGNSLGRPLSFYDRVRGPKDGKRGDLLVEIWSNDLGSKKNDLVASIMQLKVDEIKLKGFNDYANVLPRTTILDQEAKVALDRSIMLTAERTLRLWRLTDKEIEDVKKEAEEIYKTGKQDSSKLKEWGRVEVRAPFDGVILEKNIAIGDLVVDTSADLFKLANLKHLSIWAHAYEEDLPKLLAKGAPKIWKVSVISSDKQMRQQFSNITKIGEIIDPNQHTVLVLGNVANPDGILRIGQSLTAVVELPPEKHEVEVPTSALIENGAESTVLLQTGPNQYAIRRVVVARRTDEYACLRTVLTPAEQKSGLQTLQPGNTVVTAGALELVAAFKEMPDAD